MRELMSENEKKFIMVLSTFAMWFLVGLSFKIMFDSGMIERGIDKILSNYYSMIMVMQAILGTLIMGLGYTTYISVKQNNACKKAQELVKREEEREKNETKREYIVE